MGDVSKHLKTENSQASCTSCGINVVRGADQAVEVVCLICRAAILNRIFQVRRQQANGVARKSSRTVLVQFAELARADGA